MAILLKLADLRKAYEARDPALVEMFFDLSTQEYHGLPPPPAEWSQIQSQSFAQPSFSELRNLPGDERAKRRSEMVAALESKTDFPQAEPYRLYQILLELWNDPSDYARQTLLKIISTARIAYGVWKGLKQIFKEAEAKNDLEMFAALAVRFDFAYAAKDFGTVSEATLAYVVRRGWRYLRRLGQSLPAVYVDAACEFLARYSDCNWRRTWIANHILAHHTGAYGRGGFRLPKPITDTGCRAFLPLWQRTPRPLLSLLERARSDYIRQFAVDALQADFRTQLRDIEPLWVRRLVPLGSAALDRFVVWLLQNVPRFEQSAFKMLGLHEAVLRLVDSPASEARAYAAAYARVHARDLPLAELSRLAHNSHEGVRQLVIDLLGQREPRKEVGLDAWGRLLETPCHAFAAEILRKTFGPAELTPAWFRERLFSRSASAFAFAAERLPQVHQPATLGAGYFQEIFEACEDPDDPGHPRASNFALAQLRRFDRQTLPVPFLRYALLHPLGRGTIVEWIYQGELSAAALGVEYLKTLAQRTRWDADAEIAELRRSNRLWTRRLNFPEDLRGILLSWLADVRLFSAAEIGRDWLLELVASSDREIHDFAVDRLIKSFAPADFADAAAEVASAGPIDLQGATFVFTGKLATMTREEAEAKVSGVKGKALSAVSAKLHYLVIGDEGSPLYGQGRKGSKQTKAESLNAGGANIRIVSETAFLQMLAGKAARASDDAGIAGCERLWSLAIAAGPAQAPLGVFARKYMLRHHRDICLSQTDRPVDPGHEIPETFLTFARFEPLLADHRKPLRDFALEIAAWEFARWAPTGPELVALCELPFAEVRNFVAESLLAAEDPKLRRRRVDPAVLPAEAVYRFCESLNPGARALGMQLIERLPALRQPDDLFRLTESPDRQVRAFAVRILWGLQRVTPARQEALRDWLRRTLFAIPPGRMPPVDEHDRALVAKLRPLAARKAKLALIDILRDLALNDVVLARLVEPIFVEFMESVGVSERAACLVAVTQLRHRHAERTLRSI